MIFLMLLYDYIRANTQTSCFQTVILLKYKQFRENLYIIYVAYLRVIYSKTVRKKMFTYLMICFGYFLMNLKKMT